MPSFLVDFDVEPPEVWVPPTPEVIVVPADLPTLNPAVTIRLPLSEEITDTVLVPGEHEGGDVLYVAVTQERVNVWAAMVYFAPEIAIGLSTLLLLIALRKLWTWRRFTHKPGEAYCKKCWAGLTGVASDTCPECGKDIKKIRKVTKRHPFRMTGVWCAAAITAITFTTTMWFGAGWIYLWQHGFDYQSADDWWTLIDPLDRDSAFRINQTASWFDWHSAKLAAFARERDQAWIELVVWGYDEDASGGEYHLVIRSYQTTDGKLLREYSLPVESPRQNEIYPNPVRIVNINGILLVDDYTVPYRFRPGQSDAWLPIGEHEDNGFVADLAVSGDGQLIFVPINYGNELGLFSGTPDRVELHVVDAGTGEVVFKMISSPDDSPENQPLRITQHLDQSPPSIVIHDYFDSMIPLNTRGQLLLYLADGYGLFADISFRVVRCDFESMQFVEVDESTLDETEFRYDCISGEHGLHGGGGLFADYGFYTLTDREIQDAKRRNIQWASSDVLFESRGNGGLFDPHFPGIIYNADTDILLYDLDQDFRPNQPTRALEIHPPHTLPMMYSSVSRGDRWLIAEYGRGQVPLLLNRESAKPITWIPADLNYFDSHCLLYQFVNYEQQLVVVHYDRPTPAPLHRFFDRHEILIFDLPDADE